jgi:hypothetical protein
MAPPILAMVALRFCFFAAAVHADVIGTFGADFLASLLV